ncbi:MAG: DUF6433 family protein [Candidatus Poseidoniales archaeon]
MAMKPLSKIIAEVEEKKTAKQQAAVLRENYSAALKDICWYTFFPQIEWKLPPGKPPYQALPESAEQEGKLYGEIKMLKYFVNTPDGMNMKDLKREQLFIQVLEGLDPADAALLCRMKDKNIKIKKAALQEAFPKEQW